MRMRPEACNFIKKETLAQVFPCEFCEIFENHRTPPVAAKYVDDVGKNMFNLRRGISAGRYLHGGD